MIVAAIMIGLQLVNSLFENVLNSFGGIRPRRIDSLQGVIFSAWLHAGWSHLFANLPALLVLGWLVTLTSWRRIFFINTFIVLVSGFITWLAGGQNTIVIGASGWVLGLWAFLLSNAILRHRFRDFFVAMLALIFYGGLSISLWPQSGISFIGHWAGIVAGIMCSWCNKTAELSFQERLAK